jgi:hypothetical protein
LRIPTLPAAVDSLPDGKAVLKQCQKFLSFDGSAERDQTPENHGLWIVSRVEEVGNDCLGPAL